MTAEISNIPVHEEIGFFQPMLDATRTLIDACEKKQGNETDEKTPCFYTPNKGKQRPWKEVYLITNEWQDIRSYLMSKSPLLYFYEPAMRGLVNKDPQLWVFPRVEQFQQFCYREQVKVNEFNPKKCQKVPFQNVEAHFQKQISDILHDEERVYSLRTQESEKFLKLASAYLPKNQATEVQHLARVLLKVGFHHEVEDLIRILAGAVMVNFDFLKKRLRAVHTLSMKYYFYNSTDEEKKKIDCLVGRDKGNQVEALRYIERKVARSFDIAREKNQIISRNKTTDKPAAGAGATPAAKPASAETKSATPEAAPSATQATTSSTASAANTKT